MTQKNPSLVLSTTSFIGTPEARSLDSCEPSRPTVRLFKPSTAYPLCHQRVYVTQGTNLAWRSRVEKDQVMAGLPVVLGLEWCSSLKAWIWSIQLGDGELSLTDWHMCRITNKSKCAEVDVALNLYPMTSMIWWKPNIWSGLEIAPSLEENCYLINAKENWVLKALKKEWKKKTLLCNSILSFHHYVTSSTQWSLYLPFFFQKSHQTKKLAHSLWQKEFYSLWKQLSRWKYLSAW